MGIYLNPDNSGFREALNSEIYVDKSMLISLTNKVVRTKQKYVCVSRPRRFGKSMAAEMLTAYYSRSCDSRGIFDKLKISQAESYEKHLNRYNVIHLNMVNYLTEAASVDDMLELICEDVSEEILEEFSDLKFPKRQTFIRLLQTVFAQTGVPFVFIIDEWDCIFREHQFDTEAQTKYLDFLRNLLKDKSYVALAYMTGILPIKKYGKHSALNMFTEVSMTDPREYAEFTGFTEDEVLELCKRYNMPFSETKRWYDGYNLMGIATYNPFTIVMSFTGGYFQHYWAMSETYEALKVYIEMNFDGLRAAVIRLMSGEQVTVDISTFTNDMVTFVTKDDVLTLLIHLGYLTYNFFTKEVSIPNLEIYEQFKITAEILDWSEIAATPVRSSSQA